MKFLLPVVIAASLSLCSSQKNQSHSSAKEKGSLKTGADQTEKYLAYNFVIDALWSCRLAILYSIWSTPDLRPGN